MFSGMAEWDVIVVGAGVVGSWAAYHLTHRAQRTLVLDQVGEGRDWSDGGSGMW
jgi:glycine/D-amino acid oxidase-like deaminating enzyme